MSSVSSFQYSSWEGWQSYVLNMQCSLKLMDVMAVTDKVSGFLSSVGCCTPFSRPPQTGLIKYSVLYFMFNKSFCSHGYFLHFPLI